MNSIFRFVALASCLVALSSANGGQPRLAVSFPSQLGAVGAAAFGQRYNANTDADKVTLNFGLKKQSDLTAGGQTGQGMAQSGAAAGMYGPGPYGPGPYGPGPYGAGPYGNPYAPYGPGAGAGFGQGMMQPVSSQAGMHDSLGLDFGITREKGVKGESAQQGVTVGLGGAQG